MEDKQRGGEIDDKIGDVDRQRAHAERELFVRQLQKQIQNDEIERQIQPARDGLKPRQAGRHAVRRFSGHAERLLSFRKLQQLLELIQDVHRLDGRERLDGDSLERAAQLGLENDDEGDRADLKDLVEQPI